MLGGAPGTGPGPRLILCGSATSVVHELLPGIEPLRGSAGAGLRQSAFDCRDGRAFWRGRRAF
ncbi:hypothetical protein ACFYXM_27650 [Streptomyces sp. NPDC002476]|uniref:hypothetical protein n=1 Tax=Streptomyces sp. NPDC002476 TaxID=3364648 RepID=UPI00369CA625